MAIRTYVRTLVFIVRKMCLYITRYNEQLKKFLPDAAVPALAVLEEACHGFLDAVGELPVNP